MAGAEEDSLAWSQPVIDSFELLNLTSAVALDAVQVASQFGSRCAPHLTHATHLVLLPLLRPAEADHSMAALFLAAAALLPALFLTFFGITGIRPVNFGLGASIGFFSALYLTALFLYQPTCELELTASVLAALLLGTLCVFVRSIVFLAVGFFIGGFTGAFFYFICLSAIPNGLVSYWLDFFMGFGAICGAVIIAMVGELAWIVTTSVVGAHWTIILLLEIIFVPRDREFLAYKRYEPRFTRLALSPMAELRESGAFEQHILLPFIATLLLALIGIYTQLEIAGRWRRNWEAMKQSKSEAKGQKGTRERDLKKADEQLVNRKYAERQPLL